MKDFHGVAAAPSAFTFAAYRKYLSERFPPALNGFLAFLLYSCTLLASVRMRGLAVPGPLAYLAGYLWVVCVFYHLRVLDDLKDREADVRAYPDRVLSRGLLSYRHLAVTGFLAVALETALAGALGPKILCLHLATLAYSLLMFKEFFIREWLKRHLFWYGISHMFILAFMDFNILQMAAARGPVIRIPDFFLFAFLGFCMTFSLEVARKIRIAPVEKADVDTYSKVIGIRGSLLLSASFQAAVIGLTWLLRDALGLPAWFLGTTIGTWAVVVGLFILLGRNLTDAQSRKLDKVAALFYLQFYLSLLAILVFKHG
jgi:4-hydroxybenzoate polyprenyltransferase